MTRRPPLRFNPWFLAGATALVVAVVLLFPDIASLWQSHRDVARSTEALPRSFQGNRASYALALFSFFALSALATRKALLIVDQLVTVPWREQQLDVALYRVGALLLLVTLVLSATPDVIVLLVYGEVTEQTFEVVMTIDRICDGLTILPFLFALGVFFRVDQLERIGSFGGVPWRSGDRLKGVFYEILPQRDGLGDQLRIVVLVLVAALGLALLK